MISYFNKKESARRFPFFFFLITSAWIAGCTPTEKNGDVVARVNNSVLTMEMVQNAAGPDRTLTGSEIQQYANRWVVNEMLFQEALQRGFDESDHVRQTMEEALKQLSIAELLDKQVYQMADQSIQQNDISSYFQSHIAEFTLRENITRLSIAIFRSIEPANQFRISVLRDLDWSSRVRRMQSDTSSGLISSTDSVYYSQSSLYPPELWKVAGALGMQEVSFPVRTSVGFVVMRSLGQFKSGSTSPLSYVEDQIRNRLIMEQRQQRYQQYLQDLRSKHTVQMMITADDSLSTER